MNAVILFLLSGIGTAIFIPIGLPWLRRLKFGQFVRDDGPESHLAKSGTPTMGGLLFMPVIVLVALLAVRNPDAWAVLLVSISFGIVGFIDDYIKVVKKRSMGFRAWQKLLAQLLITIGYIMYMMVTKEEATWIVVPFVEGFKLNLSYLFIPFMLFFILGTVNAVNLTDGVDGLSTSVTIAVLSFFFIADVAYNAGLSSLLAISIGALFGFLIHNSHPAALFMGDTGSLALGGLVAAVAVALKLPLIILIVGLVYLAEVVSVIIQVGWYKKTGKRFFKMAPIHHHFELMGWKETKVVYIFTIITVFLCAVALLSLGIV